MQTFFGNVDQYLGGYSNPNLRFYRVLVAAEEHRDAQMLFDPFDEQPVLPALAVKVGNHLGPQSKVVGQKHQLFSGAGPDYYAAQCVGIVFAQTAHAPYRILIAQNNRVDSVHRVRIASFESDVAPGTGHEQGCGLVNDTQPGEVQISAVQRARHTQLDSQLAQYIDIVGLAVCDVHEVGDVASQGQRRMEFDGSLGAAKQNQHNYLQIQVDGGAVEWVDRPIQVQVKGLAAIQTSRHGNQVLRKVWVDLPSSRGVCKGSRIARNRLTARPHTLQPSDLRTEVDLAIDLGLPVGLLGQGHDKEMIQTEEVFDLVFVCVILHSSAKRAHGQQKHELRKYERTLEHGGFGQKSAKNPNSDFQRVNQVQTQTLNFSSNSLSYDVLMCRRWNRTVETPTSFVISLFLVVHIVKQGGDYELILKNSYPH